MRSDKIPDGRRAQNNPLLQGDERKPPFGTTPGPVPVPIKPPYSPEQKRSDLKNIGWAVAIILAIVIVWFANSYRSTSSTHDLDGSVLIFHEVNYSRTGSGCSGTGALFDLIPTSPVRITPSGERPIYTELEEGSITSEGNCRLRFSAEVPEAERYLIEVGGRLPQERSRAHIERSDGWWVTLDWDATSAVPEP